MLMCAVAGEIFFGVLREGGDREEREGAGRAVAAAPDRRRVAKHAALLLVAAEVLDLRDVDELVVAVIAGGG